VLVRMEREKKVFEATAKVTYAQNSMGMGLGVYRGQTGTSGCIAGLVAELSGEALPKFDIATASPESGNLSAVPELAANLERTCSASWSARNSLMN